MPSEQDSVSLCTGLEENQGNSVTEKANGFGSLLPQGQLLGGNHAEARDGGTEHCLRHFQDSHVEEDVYFVSPKGEPSTTGGGD